MRFRHNKISRNSKKILFMRKCFQIMFGHGCKFERQISKETIYRWQCTPPLKILFGHLLENFEKIRCCPPGRLHLGQNSLTGKYKLFRLLRFTKRTHWREPYSKYNSKYWWWCHQKEGVKSHQSSSEHLICTNAHSPLWYDLPQLSKLKQKLD